MISLLRPLGVTDSRTLAEVWNVACGKDLAVSPRACEYNLQRVIGIDREGWMAMLGDRAAGFVLASMFAESAAIAWTDMGWIDAVAVRPEFQGRGVGSGLLVAAEQWLARQGVTKVSLGGGLRPWVPGLPAELECEAFFCERGYEVVSGPLWDLARDLGSHREDAVEVDMPDITIQPAQAEQEEELKRFLQREFPGRWLFEYLQFIRERGRPSDYLLLREGTRVEGFARMTREDSERPLDRFFMHRLPRPWGQIGPIGIGADQRGKGYGHALIEAAIRHLRRRAVRGCVIDWTSHSTFYRRFGFLPYRQYHMLSKDLR